MAGCEILDFQCIIVSELIGSTILAVIVLLLLYFVMASKLKLGFDTTMILAIPFILVISLGVGGFSTIFAVIGIIAALMIAWMFDRIIGNK